MNFETKLILAFTSFFVVICVGSLFESRWQEQTRQEAIKAGLVEKDTGWGKVIWVKP